MTPCWLRLLLALTSASLSLLSPATADYGPYFQSAAYDNGTLGPWPTETYRSNPVFGASLNYVEKSPFCTDSSTDSNSDGNSRSLYTLFAPRGKSVRNPGPVIVDREGHLVWAKSYAHYGKTYNLDAQGWNGGLYLTFWAGYDGVDGHGIGSYYMLDSSYNETHKISGANGSFADYHDFRITADGTALFTVYEMRQVDLRAVDGPVDGWIWDSGFQEVDIASGNLTLQWRASEHFNFTRVSKEREGRGRSSRELWDFFHINGVDKDSRGNFLVSSSVARSLLYVDGRTGDVLWTLGGDYNDFEDLSDGAATNFSTQRHPRFRDDGSSITLVDNTLDGDGTRGLWLAIDQDRKTATLQHEYRSNEHSMKSADGSIQPLDSGNVLIGHGSSAAWTEYSATGDVLCEVHFGAASSFDTGAVSSSHVFRRPWTGRPSTRPDLYLHGHEAGVSWNGATEVATWVLEGINTTKPYDSMLQNKTTSSPFTFLAAVPKTGFETIIEIPADPPALEYLRVLALDATGHTLASTKLTRWDPLADEPVIVSGEAEDEDELRAQEQKQKEKDALAASKPSHPKLIYFSLGFLSACLLIAACIWGLKHYFPSTFTTSTTLSFSSIRDYIPCLSGRDSSDQGRGSWTPVAADSFNGDEDLSDEELGDEHEFSLLGNARLASIPDITVQDFGDYYDSDSDGDDDIV